MKAQGIWMKTAVVMATGLTLLGTAYAERDSEERGDNRRNRSEDNTEVRERFQEKLFEKMAEKLELDDATKAKMKTLFEKQSAARNSANEEMRNAVKKLKELVDKDASDAELSTQIDKVESLKQKQRDLESKSLSEMRTIIGTKKTAKLLVMQSQMMNKMREHVREGVGNSNRRGGVFRRGNERERSPNTGSWGYN